MTAKTDKTAWVIIDVSKAAINDDMGVKIFETQCLAAKSFGIFSSFRNWPHLVRSDCPDA